MQSKVNVQQIQRRDNVEKAWKLRVQGYTTREIAKTLGRSYSLVNRYLHEALALWRENNAQSLNDNIELDLARLDHYLNRLNDRINDGDANSILVALKVLEHRAKLQGMKHLGDIGQATFDLDIEDMRTTLMKRLRHIVIHKPLAELKAQENGNAGTT